jgi:hypothetical protein
VAKKSGPFSLLSQLQKFEFAEDTNFASENYKEIENTKRDGLSMIHVSAYSVGNFNNDLCAAMSFFYLSWYLNNVVGLSPTVAGQCLFSG